MYYAAPCISQTSLVIDGLNTAKLYNFQLKTDSNYVLQYATRPTMQSVREEVETTEFEGRVSCTNSVGNKQQIEALHYNNSVL